MSATYDRHEMKIIRRGVSIKKVIAAYKHFGSLRAAGRVCGIHEDTVAEVLRRNGIPQGIAAVLPKKLSYYPKRGYSKFAKWVQEHKNDEVLPYSRKALAELAGVTPNVVKCFFQRRRKAARKILDSLPDLRTLGISLEDIEGFTFPSKHLVHYKYAIERYSSKAIIQGEIEEEGDRVKVTVLIPSIDLFASRVRKLEVR